MTRRGSLENLKVLLVDDDVEVHELVGDWLRDEGHRVRGETSGEAALEALEPAPDVVLLDVQLPGRDGLDLVRELHAAAPHAAIVMLTSHRDVRSVVQAMRDGASDYLAKPLDRAGLLAALANVVPVRSSGVLPSPRSRSAWHGIAGRSAALAEVFAQLDLVVASDVPVLLRGESGTGKELVARALHEKSARSGGAFVPVNCAAIPENLIESELFGHERGAFTGATGRQVGCVERADRGTLFLDEVAELPLGAQAKLLRVLQERTFRRVGGQAELGSDFRLVSASHRSLPVLVREGRFREDLYYRIAVFDFDLPPLRDRLGDAVVLAEHFVAELAPDRALVLSPDARAAIDVYAWPGNVRELRNAIQRALVLCRSSVEIGLEHLPLPVRSVSPAGVSTGTRPTAPPPPGTGLVPNAGTLEHLEREALRAALERCGGNVSAAVRELGIGRTTAYRKMRKFGLT